LATDTVLSNWKNRSTQLLSVAALLSVGFLIWILYTAPLFQERMIVLWIPATTVASAIMITYFVVCPEGIGSRIVGLGFFVFIGDLSYTIYIVHWPVYVALQPGSSGTHWPFWLTEIVRLLIIFAIAIGSWFLIEKPLARWRKRSAAL
jgi:peptidoglycan/LPS O-acetylase OafA/YrhL